MRVRSIIVAIVWAFKIHAQDPSFINFQRAQLFTNPAFTGSSGKLQIQSAAQVLWPGAAYSSTTYAGTDYAFNKCAVGLIWSVERNYLPYSRTHFAGTYSQRIAFKKKKLIIQPGFSVRYLSTQTDWQKHVYGDQIDSTNGFTNITEEVPGINKMNNLAFDAGLLVFTSNWFVGLAIHQFNQPNEGFLAGSNLRMRLNFHSGYQRDLSDDLTVTGQLQLQKQIDHQFLSIGSTAIYKKWALGITWASSSSISLSAGWQSSVIRAGISHSVFYRGLPYSVSYGAYEAFLSVQVLKARTDKVYLDLKGF